MWHKFYSFSGYGSNLGYRISSSDLRKYLLRVQVLPNSAVGLRENESKYKFHCWIRRTPVRIIIIIIKKKNYSRLAK